MTPTLKDQDLAFGRGLSVTGRVRPGVVVLVDHPLLGLMIKRVLTVTPDGSVTLRGDGALSAPSVDLGVVAADRIQLVLRWRIAGWRFHRLR